VSEMTPEPREAPDGADLGLTPDEWMDLQFAYNSGLIEPQEGTVEDEAFRRMDTEVVRDYLRRCERDRADARYQAWAQAHPEEAAKRQAEAEAQCADPATWWDIEDPNATAARAGEGLDPEAAD
jgi:hypothetical protein